MRSYFARNVARLFAVVAGMLLVSVSLMAHHGQAGYNTTEKVTVSGLVSEFQFVNPHSIVHLDVKDDKGETQAWQGELTSPNHLIRADWTSTTLKPGDKVTMTGYRAKSGSNSMWITAISVNGEDLKMGAGN
ncbi:MAG TPA: DUF6152 family protein [Bryobacteraceae bacterium]|jgi:hypothetical protein|nr:DUF6152 family protein [Bryobacteraceae bacterium]